MDQIEKLKAALTEADTVIIRAGAGLSAAAGYIYSGECFRKYFFDFEAKYGFHDMYSGVFTQFDSAEEKWAFWSRNIWINRYAPIPSDLYEKLFELVKDKDYFVITTNVDQCCQRAGFDKKRLLYTQGDYGLFQRSDPSGRSAHMTYDNKEAVIKMLEAQGFEIREDNTLSVRDPKQIKMRIPSELIPYCEDDRKEMAMNLRADDTFVQDEGWHKVSERYTEFLRRHAGTKTVFLELGVGFNTPVIIKYPFWQMTHDNPNAVYACLNYNEAFAPEDIIEKSLRIDGDIREVFETLER
ncbi:MAG TPA: Sir2 silent information regulator family NAD-dependent deacetylase [Erysipelotrichaceae bacterium]|nr:Sir2 silent information regulator family NAD-dependent deacetylase [Erysipelotrichaceae bacterium]